MAQMQNNVSPLVGTPRWAADFLEQEISVIHFPAKCDPAQFIDKDAVLITVSAIAAQNATSFSIASALTFTGGYTKIPAGTVLYFGGQKVATLTADYTGGTTFTVAALPTALAVGDFFWYKPAGTRVAIPSGTLMGRTYAERDAGTNFGPATLTDDEVFLTLYDVMDASIGNNVEFYKPGQTVKENYLPSYSDGRNVSSGAGLSVSVNEVQTITINGTLSAGTYQYADGLGNYSVPVAYNAVLATIQSALDGLYGASKVVAAGTVASHTVTFSGTGFANTPQVLLQLVTENLTGLTTSKVARTTNAGLALLNMLRSKYRCIKGTN
jgi:hypothetical protein